MFAFVKLLSVSPSEILVLMIITLIDECFFDKTKLSRNVEMNHWVKFAFLKSLVSCHQYFDVTGLVCYSLFLPK